MAQAELGNPAVQAEAAQAVIQIAGGLPEPQTAVAALKSLLAAPQPSFQAAAEAALTKAQVAASHLLQWQASPVYAIPGTNHLALFDLVFEPETNAAAVEWKPITARSPVQPMAMDLLRHFGGGDQRVAYARTWIFSSNRQPTHLELGTDDGVKVWLNGTLLFGTNATRGLTPGQEKIALTLNTNWNELLFKVTQQNAGWEFTGRLANPDGSPLPGWKASASKPKP
jgi:hypothetical protein